MEKLKQLANRIDALSVRERAIVFVGLITILFMVWDSTLSTPLSNKQKALLTQLNSKNVERFALTTRLQELIIASQNDPDAANRERLKSLREKLVAVEADLNASTKNLVAPEEMPRLLENVLRKTAGLTLENLKSLGVSPLVAEDEVGQQKTQSNTAEDSNKLEANNITSAYKHGLRIEFGGDYFSTMDYLKKLEELEWGFFWDNFSLNVTNYPDTTAEIEIFTLSMNMNWIGV